VGPKSLLCVYVVPIEEVYICVLESQVLLEEEEEY
jgi:hypothetical protein